jgi:hypothetical protein
VRVGGRFACAVLALFADAGERFDLFDLVVVKCGRRVLAALVGPRDRVDRQRVSVGAASVVEHRREQLPMLVHIPRRQSFRVERP